MLFFAEKLTLPLIVETNKKAILEIGSSYGHGIRPILSLGDRTVSIIDPGLDADLLAEFGDRITLHKGLSLDILPRMTESFDCIFIDGDHNWYTVFNELKIIGERNLLRPSGIIILHDIGWPYGRRDMYYQPETIPAEATNAYALRGMEKGRSRLLDEGGINAEYYNALEEFGPRNGVLTAVEDYLEQTKQDYYFVKDFRQFGLGILLKKSAENNWRRANALRFRIFKQTNIDLGLEALDRGLSRVRRSGPANYWRRLRNRFFR